MIRSSWRLTALLLAMLLGSSWAAAADKPTCAECGMTVNETSLFSAKIVETKTTLHFCDIGDLLIFLKDKKRPVSGAKVKDYISGEWIDAASALYVHAPKHFSTPMSWNVAAFRNRDNALTYGTPQDLAAMTAALK